MTVPLATYRLQFRNGMTFETARALVPYWRDLGVSHLYASPIFTAVSGSTHGYDVADQNEIDPVLGGRAGFERLAHELRRAGLRIILDIVPNHMAASLENPWWRSVVQWGRESPFAGHFDIDWSRPLTLPVLGQPFEAAVAAGEVSLMPDWPAGTLALAYFDNRFPLHPRSWDLLLAEMPDGAALTGLREAARQARPEDAAALQDKLRAFSDAPAGSRLARHLEQCSRDGDVLTNVHERQPWRLNFWKTASRELSYRRFFEITGLVGLAVEKETVFDDAHRLTLELLREGLIDGLRIDHVDGLADPGGYLRRLRQAVGDEVYIVVEKILGAGEELPPDWPVAGTTGYEFIEAAADLLVDPQGLSQLSHAYETTTGSAPTDTLRQQAKRQIITRNFEGELEQVTDLFAGLPEAPDRQEIRDALVRLLVHLCVYRSYGTDGPLGDTDSAMIRMARNAAAEAEPAGPHRALDFVTEAIMSGGGEADRARMRLQQLSGPAMAKGVEDTLFYRDHRFLALNEVGGDPDRGSFSLERFHATMVERANHAPTALSATATHDTKRGEDARTRLYALSEAPDYWRGLVEQWRRRHSGWIVDLPDGPAPEPEVEWMLYQALAGVWPEAPLDRGAFENLRSRFLPYVEKVLREAKTRTGWTEIASAYEDAVKNYAARLLDVEDAAFASEMSKALGPIRQAGWLNSLTQTLVKLTAPGVPDFYQGAEGGDFSLVDPDNRRPVDWEELRRRLAAAPTNYPDRAFKQFMIKRGLAARRRHPELFAHGDYRPLTIRGNGRKHLVGFLRQHGDTALAVLAPRMSFDLLDDKGELNPTAWHDVSVAWPDGMAGVHWCEELSGRWVTPGSGSVAELMKPWPYVLLTVSTG